MNVDRYLQRIGYTGSTAPTFDSLAALQFAHLTTVPFENLDVVAGVAEIRTSLDWSVPKVVDRGRGGWCFELNGAFSGLLDTLGFDVLRLGAAVLLDGPTKVIDHLTIEVALDQPYLVDVGFGESFTRPLQLNSRGPQDGGDATYQFFDSSEGLTLTKLDGESVPVPQYRFRRVGHELADFEPASTALRTNPELHWSNKPFATRLLGEGADRVTLLKDRLKLTRGSETTETPVEPEQWDDQLSTWFGMSRERARD
jgi:N-hydroxyarylamine O-acetyltransferase